MTSLWWYLGGVLFCFFLFRLLTSKKEMWPDIFLSLLWPAMLPFLILYALAVPLNRRIAAFIEKHRPRRWLVDDDGCIREEEPR